MIHVVAENLVQELADFRGEADCIVVFAFGPDDTRWLAWGTPEGAHHAVQRIHVTADEFRQRYLREAEQGGDRNFAETPDIDQEPPSTPGAEIDAERLARAVIQQLTERKS